MAAEDQIDVGLTSIDRNSDANTSNNDKIKCSYCGCLKDGVLMFYCDQCHLWVHAS